jgi:hypothetical protein
MGSNCRLSSHTAHSEGYSDGMRTLASIGATFAATSLWLAACGGGGGSGADAGPPPPDAPPATPATAVFTPPTPGTVADWGVVPFPSDLYLDASGHLALGKLPDGPGARPGDETKLRDSLAALDGAGVWSNVYFGVDGNVDSATLAGNVKLVDLDGALAELPVDVLWRGDLHAIVAAPRWGTMLRQDHRYAAFVTSAVKASDGTPLARAPGFAAAAALGTTPSDPALAAAQASLRPLLEAYPAPDELAVATVFRTEHVTRGMKAMRDVVAATPPPLLSIDRTFTTAAELDGLFGAAAADAIPGLDDSAARPQPHAHVAAVVHGQLQLQNFLAATTGVAGLVELDANGVAQVKGTFAVKFTLVLPAQASWANLPVIIQSHGLNRTRDDMLVMAETATRQGMALLAIDLPYHGDRARMPRDTRNQITGVLGADGFGDDIGLSAGVDFFHLLESGGLGASDMRAVRDNLRQAAADLCGLVSFVAGGDLTLLRTTLAGLGGLPADLSFRPGTAILTESFGSMISLLTVAVEPRVHSAVLGVAAAGFPYPSVLHSASFSGTFSGVVLVPFDLTRVVLGDPVVGARFDPLVNLYDQALEPGDAAAFAPTVLSGELRGGVPPNLLLTMTWDDEFVPNEATEQLAGALGVPRVPISLPTPPPGEPIRFATLPTMAAPLSGNVGGSHTAGLSVYYPASHGAMRYLHTFLEYATTYPPFVKETTPREVFNPIVQQHAQWSRFLADAFAGTPPTIIDPYAP